MSAAERRLIRLEPVHRQFLSSPELMELAVLHGASAVAYQAHASYEGQENPLPLDVVHLPGRRRIGISWGSSPVWASLLEGETAEELVRMYLEAPESWDARTGT